MKVEPQDIRAALRGFLELLESTDRQVSIELLELWLGQLAFLQHFVDQCVTDCDLLLEPLHNHAYWRKRIAEKFPAFGAYDISATDLAQLASPLDDLTEIAVEIAECLHRWDVAGDSAALWYFQFRYQSHWGMRLQNLQAYLHEATF